MTSPSRISRLVLAALVAASAAACRAAPIVASSPAPIVAPAGEEGWIVQRLYVGRDIPGGGVVDDAAWDAFLREEATPRFPDGLTTYATRGQWLGANGQVVREEAFVLEVMHPASAAAEGERKVREIAAAYRVRFRQEAVLWTRDRVEARLLTAN
jgi:hypothetical protein